MQDRGTWPHGHVDWQTVRPTPLDLDPVVYKRCIYSSLVCLAILASQFVFVGNEPHVYSFDLRGVLRRHRILTNASIVLTVQGDFHSRFYIVLYWI